MVIKRACWAAGLVVVGVLAFGCVEGPAGPQGAPGEPGPVGPAGATGAAGQPGASVEVTPVPVGSNVCPNGGARFQIGGDTPAYACAGAPGERGMTGQPGPMGPTGATGPEGPAGLPGAPGPSGTTGQDIVEVLGTGQLNVAPTNAAPQLIPGLSATVNVPPGAVVYVSTSGGIQSTGSTGTTCSVVDVSLWGGTSGVPAMERRISIANTSSLAQLIGNWSFGRTFDGLQPGLHTFSVTAFNAGQGLPCATSANVSSASARQLQGVLTVQVLNR